MVADDIKFLNKLSEHSLLLNIPKEKIKQYATENPNFNKDYKYFHVMYHTEPHAIRRKAILEKYPQMEKLFEKREPYITLSCVVLVQIFQLLMCYLIYKNELTLTKSLLLALFLGAIPNHMLFVLYHDITHFNCFRSKKYNEIAAIICNLPQIIPSAIGFGRYHRDHHTYLGDKIKDPDIPTVFEINLLRTTVSRILFILVLPLFYGLRPYFKAPKSMSFMEFVNIVACSIFAFFTYKIFGVNALVYLFFSTWFGLSINPVAVHVIAEHYEFVKNQDTYSYYGWINYINFNMGYHIEHHDFPNIPWYKLPQVKQIAPEFYNTLPQMDSYVTVMFKYIFDGAIGPWSRIILENKEN